MTKENIYHSILKNHNFFDSFLSKWTRIHLLLYKTYLEINMSAYPLQTLPIHVITHRYNLAELAMIIANHYFIQAQDVYSKHIIANDIIYIFCIGPIYYVRHWRNVFDILYFLYGTAFVCKRKSPVIVLDECIAKTQRIPTWGCNEFVADQEVLHHIRHQDLKL